MKKMLAVSKQTGCNVVTSSQLAVQAYFRRTIMTTSENKIFAVSAVAESTEIKKEQIMKRKKFPFGNVKNYEMAIIKNLNFKYDFEPYYDGKDGYKFSHFVVDCVWYLIDKYGNDILKFNYDDYGDVDLDVYGWRFKDLKVYCKKLPLAIYERIGVNHIISQFEKCHNDIIAEAIFDKRYLKGNYKGLMPACCSFIYKHTYLTKKDLKGKTKSWSDIIAASGNCFLLRYIVAQFKRRYFFLKEKYIDFKLDCMRTEREYESWGEE